VRRVWPGRPEQRTHDYLRHGTTTLFAALEVATGRVTNQCAPRHRHPEFLAFLKQVAGAYPRRQLHVVCDNYATHKHPVVRGWLAKHPRIQLHFTPTSASWLNLVEVFFSIVDRQALRRGDFLSVEDLTVAIGRFCQSWNEHCQPFSWTKPADQILTNLNRQTNSATEHRGEGGRSCSAYPDPSLRRNPAQRQPRRRRIKPSSR
jgi:transposase